MRRDATLAVIQRNLARLSTKMVEMDYDILKFNAHVHEMMNQLTVRNEAVPSLLAELFMAYKLVPDEEYAVVAGAAHTIPDSMVVLRILNMFEKMGTSLLCVMNGT